mmetsp:Transcript_22464/g.56775  ORF Transcript_22464/g.56775 Transcript_22464/m.56775 type:complete len:212 (+) Transcript_22464:2214-2849(+)
MLECRYSSTLSRLSSILHPAALRSADASDNSKACSTVRSGRPSISSTLPEKNVLLALLLHGQQPLLDRVVGDRVHEIPQRDPRLQGTVEPHQHRLRHVQRHHAGGGRERHESRARREGNTQREPRVGVSARAHLVGQEHAVQPAVNNPVTRPERDAAAVMHEVRECVVRDDVDRFWVGGRVAEALHHEVGGEAQARQVLQLVPRHRTRGVL